MLRSLHLLLDKISWFFDGKCLWATQSLSPPESVIVVKPEGSGEEEKAGEQPSNSFDFTIKGLDKSGRAYLIRFLRAKDNPEKELVQEYRFQVYNTIFKKVSSRSQKSQIIKIIIIIIEIL